MRLYYSPGSCSMACHIALEETGAEFEPIAVHLAKGENVHPDYLAVHPQGFVPLLEMQNGERLTEAAAILLHTARAYPLAGLLPESGSLEEARAFEWLAWLTNTLHVAYACLWRPERFTADGKARKAIVSEAKERIARLNAMVDERLGRRDYGSGNRYSIADPFLLVFFRWANRIGLEASDRYPAWADWARRIERRPAVQTVLEREGVRLWDAVAQE